MKRISSLDSLRGIAAAIVVLAHLVGTLPDLRAALIGTVVLRPLLMGSAWVSVFFVLSGFVLYLTFDGKDHFRYAPFLVKRVARIYPPLVFAVLASLGLYLLVAPRPIPALGDWFNLLSWSEPPTPAIVAGHLLLLDGPRFQMLDNVIWSLVHEMRISILFPLLALCVRARPQLTLAATFGLAVVAYFLVAALPPDLPVNAAATLQYLFCFAAGAVLARRRETVAAWFDTRQGWLLGGAMAFAGIALMSFSPARLAGMLTQSGAIMIVAACFAHPALQRPLALAPLRWLGRVSYSLYLIHLPILLALVHATAGVVPAGVAVAAALPVALLAAELTHRLVERPSILIGRWMAARLRPPAPAIR